MMAAIFGDQFAHPEFLWLLLVLPAMGGFSWWKRKSKGSFVQFSSTDQLLMIPASWRVRIRYVPTVLRYAALAALIVALARPQDVSSGEDITTEGIDIVLSVDISGSMLAEDFSPNRLVAAKAVAKEFIDGRTSDRIGLVIFAGEAFTQCPLTADYQVLKRQLEDVKFGMVEDGTAIGLALANAVNRLKDSKAKSKVIILLTDGVNNRGEIDPLTAARLAASFNIKVYTVGVGGMGSAPMPVQTPWGMQRQLVPVEIDEKVLREVASLTGGTYYRATDNAKLRSIYAEIDRLERTIMDVSTYKNYKELFGSWVFTGLALLAAQVLLSRTVLRRLP